MPKEKRDFVGNRKGERGKIIFTTEGAAGAECSFPGYYSRKKRGKYTIEKCRRRGLRGGRKDKALFSPSLLALRAQSPFPLFFRLFLL